MILLNEIVPDDIRWKVLPEGIINLVKGDLEVTIPVQYLSDNDIAAVVERAVICIENGIYAQL